VADRSHRKSIRRADRRDIDVKRGLLVGCWRSCCDGNTELDSHGESTDKAIAWHGTVDWVQSCTSRTTIRHERQARCLLALASTKWDTPFLSVYQAVQCSVTALCTALCTNLCPVAPAALRSCSVSRITHSTVRFTSSETNYFNTKLCSPNRPNSCERRGKPTGHHVLAGGLRSALPSHYRSERCGQCALSFATAVMDRNIAGWKCDTRQCWSRIHGL
jgi:hypothetical protein